MIVGRILGWLLVAAALATAGWEVWRYFDTGAYVIVAAGELWYALGRGSLNLTQSVIQRYLHPALWDPVIVTVLLAPAWAILGAAGIALHYLFRKRPKRRHFAGPRG